MTTGQGQFRSQTSRRGEKTPLAPFCRVPPAKIADGSINKIDRGFRLCASASPTPDAFSFYCPAVPPVPGAGSSGEAAGIGLPAMRPPSFITTIDSTQATTRPKTTINNQRILTVFPLFDINRQRRHELLRGETFRDVQPE
ncbi:MAG: hypothetical protein PW791_14195 [Neorhizobium sp.]|nr:hypothetical protein [Neorhizobium sp.]